MSPLSSDVDINSDAESSKDSYCSSGKSHSEVDDYYSESLSDNDSSDDHNVMEISACGNSSSDDYCTALLSIFHKHSLTYSCTITSSNSAATYETVYQ